ncbi:PDZ domain-containing protein [Paenibacillus sp. MMS18-CY102]|uniref:PDZ domain-containing protein n=1 Tax=Paenibacillus sp. MMS18-CY102 TaxID=2682849 RepID=UPI00136615A3|nr:PDZ domain-containing protein [Paenibacillus sp. MMS18-CY102]MWC30587.1 serine protease [Paenibacillus sp. MMS18-CY102]
MNAAMEWLRLIGDGVLHALAQPFYYIALLLIALIYIRGTAMERRLFHVRLHAWPLLLVRTIVAGLVAGVILSGLSILIGASLTTEAALWLWGTAGVLALIRVRYLCFAYAAGVLGLLQWLNLFIQLEGRSDWLGDMAASLAAIDIPAVLLLVALLHGAEALLVRRQGSKFATPLFMEGKRGKLIGAYRMQGYWAVPLLLLVPTSEGGVQLPWTPLLPWLSGDSAGTGTLGWSFAAVPMVIGFTEWTRSQLPEHKARHAAKSLLWYSIAVVLLALAAAWLPALLPVAAFGALVLHELLIWLSNRKETEATPIFVHDERGLMVLGVVPGTPAALMGLQSGEMLHKVNGMRVRTKEQLYDALHRNSAFCKLEVLNRDGQQRFVQRARYAGEHHQLGVILAPDDHAEYYAEPSPGSLFELFLRGRAANRRESAYSASQAGAAAMEQAAALALPAGSGDLPKGTVDEVAVLLAGEEPGEEITILKGEQLEPRTPSRRSRHK